MRHLVLSSIIFASIQVCIAEPRVFVSAALEPAFYSTGDYQSFMKSVSLNYWPTQYLAIAASTGRFDFVQDRGAWYTSIQSDIYGLEAFVRSKAWRRQRVTFGLGLSMQHKLADETFLELAAKDSLVIQKFQSGFMNTPSGELKANIEDFRMRTQIRDKDGYYRVGISQVRDYSLYGASTFLEYSVNIFGDVWAHLKPTVRYYPSEPLYIWSIGLGFNIPLLPG